MVETVTLNFGWTKPEITKSAATWGGFLNNDLDAIDAQVFANQSALSNYLPLAGGNITGSLGVSGTIQGSFIDSTGTVQGATVYSTGNISANGSVTGNNGVTAGGSGFSTGGPLTANGGISAGAATIQTTGNVSCDSVTTNTVTTGGVTYFFHNTYGDFRTWIDSANNSRWLQFATGWSIQAIVSNSAYYFYIGGNSVATLDYAGNLVVGTKGYQPGGGSWGASSDERVKRDIEPYRSGLDELSQLEPVSFAYNGQGGTQDDGKRYVGLIAQMAQRAMPSLVHELPGEFEGKLAGQLATDTSELVFTLLNAVKELSVRVAELEAR